MSEPLRPHFTDGTLIYDAAGHRLFTTGAGAPTASASGYAVGALYLDVTNAAVYQNTGTADSATWTPRGAGAQGAALTAQLTTITHTAPVTPDYALQALVQNTGFGFATADEGNTLLSVVKNLQTRLAEVEAILEAAGLAAAN